MLHCMAYKDFIMSLKNWHIGQALAGSDGTQCDVQLGSI